jgi:MOSC domain-containing protein YiiM
LPRVHGSPIFVGPVELAVWRDCAPCSVMDDTIGRGAQHALRSRGGVSAQVVSGGSIRLGDAVHF